jgi:mannose-6-phosphate isomerase-like protein (cupin superfamily)
MGKNKMSNPYTDTQVTDKYTIREFNENIDPVELKWHRDLKDRTVTVLEGNGWYFQRDNELPLELKEGVCIFIPKLEWHRVIKGNTLLKVKIQE